MKSYLIPSFMLLVCSCQNRTDKLEQNREKVLQLSYEEIDSIKSTKKKQTPQLPEKNDLLGYTAFLMNESIAPNESDTSYHQGFNHYYSILDTLNGYAEVRGAYDAKSEYRIWKMSNGNDLIGEILTGYCSECRQQVYFYEASEKKITDVTETVLPWDELNTHAEKIKTKVLDIYGEQGFEGIYYAFLPSRYKSSIEVNISLYISRMEFPIASLQWNETKFIIAEKYEKIPTRENN